MAENTVSTPNRGRWAQRVIVEVTDAAWVGYEVPADAMFATVHSEAEFYFGGMGAAEVDNTDPTPDNIINDMPCARIAGSTDENESGGAAWKLWLKAGSGTGTIDIVVDLEMK